MIRLNKKSIKVDGDKIVFLATTYCNDNSLAIICETTGGEYYDDITVNLSGYGKVPEDGWIFINHNIINTELLDKFLNKFCTSEQVPITYGFARSLAVKLNDETIEKIKKGV